MRSTPDGVGVLLRHSFSEFSRLGFIDDSAGIPCGIALERSLSVARLSNVVDEVDSKQIFVFQESNLVRLPLTRLVSLDRSQLSKALHPKSRLTPVSGLATALVIGSVALASSAHADPGAKSPGAKTPASEANAPVARVSSVAGETIRPEMLPTADPLELGPAHGWQGILGDVLLDARCFVEVRLIKGSGRIEEAESQPGADSAEAKADVSPADASDPVAGELRNVKVSGHPAPEVENTLADLRPQLEALPFSRYVHLSTLSQTIPVEETGLFSLKPAEGEEQLLFVAPQTVTGDGVSLMVDWKDVGGEELVSTRLKVLNGEGVVLGTDLSPDSSAIVGVRAKCR